MTRLIELRARAGSFLAAALVIALVVSCGGGGVVGSGGTGRVTSITQGTVNGFGSVIVDGLSYDDRSAPAVAELAPGVDSPSDVKLGQRVAIEVASDGVASTVRVEAALAGPVAALVSATQLSVLGQVVTANTNGNAGPITQFGGGYNGTSSVQPGDAIEVHGLLVRQAGAYQIQATRIDKLAAAPAYLRVSGIVSTLTNGSSASLTLGALVVDLTGANVLPAGTALANGQGVTVLASSATLTMPTAGSWRAQAAQVRIDTLPAEAPDDVVSGSLSHLDTQAKTFTLGSLLVNYAGATLSPTGAALSNGQYVQVRGAVAADGSLTATGVTIRNAGSDTEAELKGNITGYVAATKQFSVRGVAVDASGASVQGCPASGLADGLFVQVEGAVSSTGVVAKQVHCEDEPSGGTIERSGVASTVDVAAMSFSLVPQQGTATAVQWSASTFFSGVTPQTMAGRRVQVQGALVGGVLMASKVVFDE